MNHTPGPWRVDIDDYTDVVVCVDDAEIGRTYIADIADRHGETIANAHLIAAAPDLLAALKYLLELGADDDRRIAAEAAIAKAENTESR